MCRKYIRAQLRPCVTVHASDHGLHPKPCQLPLHRDVLVPKGGSECIVHTWLPAFKTSLSYFWPAWEYTGQQRLDTLRWFRGSQGCRDLAFWSSMPPTSFRRLWVNRWVLLPFLHIYYSFLRWKAFICYASSYKNCTHNYKIYVAAASDSCRFLR